ncbi:MAG: hypothetical protein ABIO70_21515 [Pseudomonadota bacterium]
MKATAIAGALAFAAGACADPPRQDLRDQGYGVSRLPGASEAGDGPPSFQLTPGEPTQTLHIEVRGLDAGWLQIHDEPGFFGAMLGLAPNALHVQAFDQPSFDVLAPASLHATVRIGVTDEQPRPPEEVGRPRRTAESEPVTLRGGGANIVLQVRVVGPEEAPPRPAGAPSSPPPGFAQPDRTPGAVRE